MATTQVSVSSQAASGATPTYDALVIISIGEEDGELKITNIKDFPDPQKRSVFLARALNPATERGSASQIDKNVRV